MDDQIYVKVKTNWDEPVTEQKYMSNFFSALSAVHNSGDYSDVTLLTQDGGRFKVNRLVLSLSGTFFKKLFANDKHSEITLGAVTEDILSAVLKFCYSAQVTITNANVQDLLVAADFFTVLDLRRCCEEYIKDHLDVKNYSNAWRLADQYSCSALGNSVTRFISKNFNQILKAGPAILNDLPITHFTDVINRATHIRHQESNTVLSALDSELCRLELIRNYVNHSAERVEFMTELLKGCHLPLLLHSDIPSDLRTFINSSKDPEFTEFLSKCLEIDVSGTFLEQYLPIYGIVDNSFIYYPCLTIHYYNHVSRIGSGLPGSEFKEYYPAGEVTVSGMTVWFTSYQLSGMLVDWTDGHQSKFGNTTSSDGDRVQLEPGELIVNIEVELQQHGTVISSLKFKTSHKFPDGSSRFIGPFGDYVTRNPRGYHDATKDIDINPSLCGFIGNLKESEDGEELINHLTLVYRGFNYSLGEYRLDDYDAPIKISHTCEYGRWSRPRAANEAYLNSYSSDSDFDDSD